MEVDDSEREKLPQVEREVDDSEKERRPEEVQESQVEQRPAMEVDDSEKEKRHEEVQESAQNSPYDMVGTEVTDDSFQNRDKTNLNLGRGKTPRKRLSQNDQTA